MSDLRPRGTQVMIGGEAHSLLFTLNVIDAIQSRYDETVSQTMKRLFDDFQEPQCLRFILTELLNDEKIRNGEKHRYTVEEVGSMVSVEEKMDIKIGIFQAYGAAAPIQEDDDNEDEATEMLDVAQLILMATTKMGYSEEEVFAMTPRKFFLLFDKFLSLNGNKKTEEKAPILMLP